MKVIVSFPCNNSMNGLLLLKIALQLGSSFCFLMLFRFLPRFDNSGPLQGVCRQLKHLDSRFILNLTTSKRRRAWGRFTSVNTKTLHHRLWNFC